MPQENTIKEEVGAWAAASGAQQPILIISHSQAFIEDISSFAKRAAVCETHAASPCGTCKACRQADGGSHPDTISITGEKNKISVKDIALLRTTLTNTSAKRMICIPHAEDILPAAANALLKTLEEPTVSSRFLLCAPSKRSVLPTIRSRCKVLFASPLLQERASINIEELLLKLASLRPAGPFSKEELEEISRLIHEMALDGGANTDLFRVSMRLRDYHKTASFPGGNVKLAADILLASLAQLRNTTR